MGPSNRSGLIDMVQLWFVNKGTCSFHVRPPWGNGVTVRTETHPVAGTGSQASDGHESNSHTKGRMVAKDRDREHACALGAVTLASGLEWGSGSSFWGLMRELRLAPALLQGHGFC